MCQKFSLVACVPMTIERCIIYAYFFQGGGERPQTYNFAFVLFYSYYLLCFSSI
uniref:Uncharacterized protein n=1 Tax=Anguilla anguilla TaxID=7936 RepID=A0A0E9XUZ6_ANGAN